MIHKINLDKRTLNYFDIEDIGSKGYQNDMESILVDSKDKFAINSLLTFLLMVVKCFFKNY